MKFRIYYEDGATYSGDPYLAIPSGAIIVAIEDVGANNGFRLTKSKDAFFWKHDRWWGCDVLGLHDYLTMHIGPKAVLFGRTIRDDLYWEIVQRAIKEGISG